MEYKRPDRRVVRCWIAYTMIAALAPSIASVILFHVPKLPAGVLRVFTMLWCGTLALLLAVYYPLRYRHMRYAVDKHAITAVRGVFFLSHQRLPLRAVRHVTIIRGPFERLTGICALFIRATGGQMLLEGIPADDADRLMQALL